MVWGVVLVAAIAWPGRIVGALSGAPFDVPAIALLLGVVLPALWVLYPAFLQHRLARGIIVVLLGWKLLAWMMLPQGGWCGTFLTKYPDTIGGYRLAQGWDVRTWDGRRPHTCSAVVARGYSRQTQFPAWIVNIPFGQDRLVQTDEPESLFVENARPPEGQYAFLVNGAMFVESAGTMTIDTGSDVTLSGTVDAASVAGTDGSTVTLPMDAGPHVVSLQLDMRGRDWRFIPRWNGSDLFDTVATSTAPLTPFAATIQRVCRFISPTLILGLLGCWIAVAWSALRPGAVAIVSIAAVATAAAWTASGGADSSAARFAVLLLLAVIVIPVPRALRTTRGAWLLVATPWLALLSTIGFRSIGGFRLYLFGDDSLTFQRFAYRIFMDGFWLEGGQPTFWNQPLYRWLCGTLHVIFGDSSVGELLLDGFGLLVGALFAYEVVNRTAGFRAGVAAAVAVLVTTALGPNWYLLGRGLSEIAASMWLYLAAIMLTQARDGSPARHGMIAGLFATLAFYTRLNHLPLILALSALSLPETTPAGAAFKLQSWRQLPRLAGPYLLVIAVGLAAFTARTWYFTGVLDPFVGTTRLHNATGLGLTIHSLWSAEAWRRALESVAMIVTVQDPPRLDVRSLLVLAGFAGALLALVGVPVARRLPLGVAVMAVASVAGGLVARGVAYPGRFSVHVIPVAVAIAVSIAGLAMRGAAVDRRTAEPAVTL